MRCFEIVFERNECARSIERRFVSLNASNRNCIWPNRVDERCCFSRFDFSRCLLYLNRNNSGNRTRFSSNPPNPRENTSSEPNHCAVVTLDEMLLTKSVKERISWTRSDSELAKRQRSDSANKIIVLALKRYSVKLEDSLCTFGNNPISNEEAPSWGNLEALELWSNWEDLATSNGFLYRKRKPSNRVNER